MKAQARFNLDTGRHGGRRNGSGRKRIHSKGVAHRPREQVSSRTPLHLNFKFRTHIRNKEALRILKRAILNSRKQGLKILHYSMQSNHIHLIVEAINNQVLTRGMRSLTVTFGKGIQKGRIQIERYHLHVLRALREAKNALKYVLLNEQRHSGTNKLYVDGYCSIGVLGIEWIRAFIKKEKLGLVWKETKRIVDSPQSWILKAALSLLSDAPVPEFCGFLKQ